MAPRDASGLASSRSGPAEEPVRQQVHQTVLGTARNSDVAVEQVLAVLKYMCVYMYTCVCVLLKQTFTGSGATFLTLAADIYLCSALSFSPLSLSLSLCVPVRLTHTANQPTNQ